MTRRPDSSVYTGRCVEEICTCNQHKCKAENRRPDTRTFLSINSSSYTPKVIEASNAYPMIRRTMDRTSRPDTRNFDSVSASTYTAKLIEDYNLPINRSPRQVTARPDTRDFLSTSAATYTAPEIEQVTYCSVKQALKERSPDTRDFVSVSAKTFTQKEIDMLPAVKPQKQCCLAHKKPDTRDFLSTTAKTYTYKDLANHYYTCPVNKLPHYKPEIIGGTHQVYDNTRSWIPSYREP